MNNVSDFEQVFIDACDEAGCAYDNEALLQRISDLKGGCTQTNLEAAREFCAGAFGPFGVNIEPYAKIIAELMDQAVCRALMVSSQSSPSPVEPSLQGRPSGSGLKDGSGGGEALSSQDGGAAT